ncbi:MAG TPA: DUF3352 domain-containing protein [Candidatus Desulfaltia sp.]|nr:DUF3352 domain-containing protein [Candidatus Desulfaltia sp.]
MKRIAASALAIVFVLVGLMSCSKATAPKAGSAKATDMLSLLPVEAKGAVVVDVQRIMQNEFVQKSIAENEDKAKYDEFVQTTGIDPQQDIFFFVAAMMGDIGQKEPDGAGLVNLRYNKDKVLALAKKEGGELGQEEYSGLTVYRVAAGEDKKPMSFVFLDESNILLGTDTAVRKVIDVYQKKADNIWKSEDMSTLLKGMSTTAMVWGGFAIPPDAMKQASSQNPMLSAFSDIRSIVLSFDYKDKNFLAEIKALSPDAAKNKQMGDALNGFKALGAGAAAQEPLFGEVLNRIEISSATDHVRIAANLSEELIKSLGEKMKPKKPKAELDENEN